MEPKTIKLKRPLQLGDKTVTELHINRAPCAGDLRGLKVASLVDMSTDDVMKVMSRLCGHLEADLWSMSVEDMGEVLKLFHELF